MLKKIYLWGGGDGIFWGGVVYNIFNIQILLIMGESHNLIMGKGRLKKL